jgi:hypothetical protein
MNIDTKRIYNFSSEKQSFYEPNGTKSVSVMKVAA